MYCIKTPHTKAIKKALLKYGRIKIKNGDLEGTIHFKGVRVYSTYWEVDVVFEGLACFKMNQKVSFYDSSLMKRRVSKIKVNRILKNYMRKEVDMRLRYFGGNLRSYDCIKKIEWL